MEEFTENMDDEVSGAISRRFFGAIDRLIADRKLRGKQTFCVRYKINKRNFYYAIDNPTSKILRLSWLAFLVNDYGLSARYLLTGEGEFYARKEPPETVKKPGDTANLLDGIGKVYIGG